MKNIEKRIKKEANNSSFEFKEEYWNATLKKLQSAKKGALIKKLSLGLLGLISVGVISYYGINKNNLTKNNITVENSNIDNNNLLANSSERKKLEVKNDNRVLNQVQNDYINEKKINKKKERNIVDNKKLNKTKVSINNTLSLEQKTNSLLNNNVSSEIQPKANYNQNSKNTSVNNTSKSNLNGKTNNTDSKIKEINNQNVLQQNNSIEKADKTNHKSNVNLIQNREKLKYSESKEKNNQKGLIKEDLKPIELEPKTQDVISKIASPPTLRVNKSYKLTLQAFAGANISKSIDSKNTLKIDFPYVGIEVGYIFKNNMLLTLGAGWYQNYNINYSLESETETLYSYGKTQVMESIVLNKMYWLEIPIKISYPISTKSRVGFGAAYSQLLGGKSTYSRQDIFTDYSSSEVTSTEMSDIYNGYSDKISTKNYSILSSYQYQYNKFGTELKYYYGLNNLINEEEIKNNRVTLTIKYSIF